MQEAKALTRPSLLVDVICAKIVCAGPEVYYSKLLCCHRYIPVTQLNHCLYSLGIFSFPTLVTLSIGEFKSIYVDIVHICRGIVVAFLYLLLLQFYIFNPTV